MNRIVKYMAIAAMALASASCLDLTSKEDVSDGNLWSGAGGFRLFANEF